MVEVNDEKVEEALERLASSRKDFEPRGKTAKAREGDRVVQTLLDVLTEKPWRVAQPKVLSWSLGRDSLFRALKTSLWAPRQVTQKMLKCFRKNMAMSSGGQTGRFRGYRA